MRDGRVYATPDGPRYKALGNSMALPWIRWILERMAAVDRIVPLNPPPPSIPPPMLL
jgi:hypothetical protein